MSLLGALNSAVTGLKANQVGLDVVSRNIANAGTPGYTKKIAPRENAMVGTQGAGVRMIATQRQVDFRLQQNLRLEESRSGRLDVVTDFLKRIDEMFGRPEQETSIAYGLNQFATRMGELADNSADPGVRGAVVDQAAAVARQLNQMSQAIQDMRSQTEHEMAIAVDQVNTALKGIEELNHQIANRTLANQTTADLEDRRDLHLKTLAQNLDIRYVQRGDGQITVFTNSGHTLVNEKASQFQFQTDGVLHADELYNTDPLKNGVATLTLVTPGGSRIDILQDGPPKQGKIAGLLELRDERLVEAQTQLDEIAHTLALSLSERQVDFTSAYRADFDRVDGNGPVDPLADGDRFSFTYMEGGRPRTITAYAVSGTTPSDADLRERVPDPENAVFVRLPLTAPTTAQAIYNAISPRVPGNLLTDPSTTGTPNILSVVSGSESLVRSMVLHSPSTSTTEGPHLNLFTDGTSSGGMVQIPYTGRISDGNFMKAGFAGRIAVNKDILADDTRLVVYDRGAGDMAPLGDMTRPQELLSRLTESRFRFSADTGLGQAANPYEGTILDFTRTVVSYQGTEAATIKDLSTDQETRTKLLDERLQGQSGVNVDDEMAQLILLQSNYAASAKVVQTIDKMLDDLMSLVR